MNAITNTLIEVSYTFPIISGLSGPKVFILTFITWCIFSAIFAMIIVRFAKGSSK
jgi:hypothetical protein